MLHLLTTGPVLLHLLLLPRPQILTIALILALTISQTVIRAIMLLIRDSTGETNSMEEIRGITKDSMEEIRGITKD